MLFEKRERDYNKHYPYDEDFSIDRTEYFIPLYFVDNGKRKGRILIEKECCNCVILWSVKIYEEYLTTKLCDTRKIGLFVYRDNEIAIALYKKLGFTILKEYSHPNDYFMEKIIKNT